MLNLYDTITSPGATVVKLLTGRRLAGEKTHTKNSATQAHLLHIVEPAADGADSVRQESCTAGVRRAA